MTKSFNREKLNIEPVGDLGHKRSVLQPKSIGAVVVGIHEEEIGHWCITPLKARIDIDILDLRVVLHHCIEEDILRKGQVYSRSDQVQRRRGMWILQRDIVHIEVEANRPIGLNAIRCTSANRGSETVKELTNISANVEEYLFALIRPVRVTLRHIVVICRVGERYGTIFSCWVKLIEQEGVPVIEPNVVPRVVLQLAGSLQ